MSENESTAPTQPSWPEPGSTVSWFEGCEHADKSEGRDGGQVTRTHTSDPLVCHEAVRGAGVQGSGDGWVNQVTLTVRDDGSVARATTQVYGSRWFGPPRYHVWLWQNGFEHLNIDAGDQRGIRRLPISPQAAATR